MSIIVVIAFNLLCMGHAVVHDSEPAESAACAANDQQCGTDNVGLLQAKIALEEEEADVDDGEKELGALTDDERRAIINERMNLVHDRKMEWADYHLTQSDFDAGTYRIKTPGTYYLDENIVFEPTTPNMFPDITSTEYHHTLGYFLGFFAALAVETNGVVIDCQGNKLEMSAEFHKHQRFFALIELGSKPFIMGAGPPPFSRPQMNPQQFVAPNGVVIQNCELGLSSHYGIHGNDAQLALIHDITCKDFEVACISLNNCQHCALERINVDGNLKDTFPADLSQAVLLNHLVNFVPHQVGEPEEELGQFFPSVQVKLNKNSVSADVVFDRLKTDLDKISASIVFVLSIHESILRLFSFLLLPFIVQLSG